MWNFGWLTDELKSQALFFKPHVIKEHEHYFKWNLQVLFIGLPINKDTQQITLKRVEFECKIFINSNEEKSQIPDARKIDERGKYFEQ